MGRTADNDPSMEDILESIRRIVVDREGDGPRHSARSNESGTALSDEAMPTDIVELLVEEISGHGGEATNGVDDLTNSQVSSESYELDLENLTQTKRKANSGYNPPKINKILIGGKSNLTMSLKAEQRRVQDTSFTVTPPELDIDETAASQSVPTETKQPEIQSTNDEADILDLTQLVDLEPVESTKGVWVRNSPVEAGVVSEGISPTVKQPSAQLSEQRVYQRHFEEQIKQALSLDNYFDDDDAPAKREPAKSLEDSDDLSESLDGYIRELVQERVQHWLDTSLEDLVERIVREEIKTALRRPKK